MAGLGEEVPTVEYSINQRWPVAGEPVCVLCGKYGAYICDQTEKDVCSLECKFRNISNISRSSRAQLLPDVMHVRSSEKSASSTQCSAPFLTSKQIEAIRSELQLSIVGSNVPPPFVEFSDAGDVLPEKMVDNMRSADILSPTPVQMQTLPLVLQGRDILAAAPPGSGKTAAFLLPLLARVVDESRSDGSPRVLVLAATRELAQQLEEHTKVLAKGLPNIHTALVVGGLPTKPQVYRLRTAAQIVIATPGKLESILRDNIEDEDFFSEVLAVVLDEADRMLQKEFDGQVIPILDRLPAGVQKLMFSATLNDGVKKIASSLLINPVTLTVGEANMPSASVQQTVIWVEEAAKKNHLFALLGDPKHYAPPVLVFVERQQGAELLADAIVRKCDLTACAVHGGLDQSTRSKLVAQFTANEFPVLVSTPLLGRGMDWPHVKLVINFDMPAKIAEFVHQTGRAGRMGTVGRAVTFINRQSSRVFSDLCQLLGTTTRLPVQVTTTQRSAAVQSTGSRYPAAAAAVNEEAGIKRKSTVTAQSMLAVLKSAHGKNKKKY